MVKKGKRVLSSKLFLFAAVACVSASLIVLQLSYLRNLSVSHYHHYSFLIMSTALLGFGASGPFLYILLSFGRKQKTAHTQNNVPSYSVTLIYLLLLFFIASVPASKFLLGYISPDMYAIVYDSRQIAALALYIFVLFIPFFLGASILGLLLSMYKTIAGKIYGSDLIGSGIGGVAVLFLMLLFPPHSLVHPLVGIQVAALLCFTVFDLSNETVKNKWMYLTAAAFFSLLIVIIPHNQYVDQYKDLSHFQRLISQGDAVHIDMRYSPRGRFDVFEASSFHTQLFVSPGSNVKLPSQYALLIDGNLSGSIPKITEKSQAKAFQYSPQALPYKLKQKARVLILGEAGTANIWLADSFGAKEITVVNRYPEVGEIYNSSLKRYTDPILGRKSVNVVYKEPRIFLENTDKKYDIIHLAGAEGMPAASGGMYSLYEDYVLTQEGIKRCLESLRPGGIISITRGLQTPPRDNARMLLLGYYALKAMGYNSPLENIVQSRNYLGVNTIISKGPISERQINTILKSAEKLSMDVSWHPEIRFSEIKQTNQLPGPEGASYSYFAEIARQLDNGNLESIRKNWLYDISPVTDNRPYFHSFLKQGTISELRKQFGGHWIRKINTGILVLWITLAVVSMMALLFILLPLAIRVWGHRESIQNYNSVTGKISYQRGKPALLLFHFFFIGIGFMFFEMIFIHQLTRFLGNAAYTASASLTALMVCAGIGSIIQERFNFTPERRVQFAVGVILSWALFYAIFHDLIINLFSSFPFILRYIFAIGIIMPLGFFLGWCLPSGVERISEYGTTLVAWAWGVNGAASVIASPLAIILAMNFGFTAVLGIAFACYLAAGVGTVFWSRNSSLADSSNN